MISQNQIHEIVEKAITGTDIFIVDIKVVSGNKITVEIDKAEGIGIEQCVEISRIIESNFDRETEDFELEVSSPGLGEPFKVFQQYQKNIGKTVEVLTKAGIKQTGALLEATEKSLKIEIEKKVKPEGKKKKELVKEVLEYETDQLKSTRIKIIFK